MLMLDRLAHGLERDVQDLVWRRFDALLSELKYKEEQRDRRLRRLRHVGWDYERLSYLLALNSFYQVVLLPIEAVSVTGTNGLGADIEIVYGNRMRHNSDSASAFQEMIAEYMAACAEFGASERILTANRTGDVLYILERMFANGE